MVKLTELIFPLALLFAACTERQEIVVLTGLEDFREGDLVFRCGFGAESRVVADASHSTYSHIGILHYDSLTAQWMVIHAVPGETVADDREYLKSEPVKVFYAADRAFRGAWARVDCADSIAIAATQYALQKVEEQVEFDNDYQLSDTTQLYCTELVWQAYCHQGIDLSDQKRHEVPVFVCKDGECIFPSDIEKSTKIIYVKPFKTQEQ
ncbi:MAG: hypothetical protein J6Y38_07385 [Bacteroidaceae bacterium]|nr:hypothetical protein [Bacteroidaceae bacterium]